MRLSDAITKSSDVAKHYIESRVVDRSRVRGNNAAGRILRHNHRVVCVYTPYRTRRRLKCCFAMDEDGSSSRHGKLANICTLRHIEYVCGWFEHEKYAWAEAYGRDELR